MTQNGLNLIANSEKSDIQMFISENLKNREPSNKVKLIVFTSNKTFFIQFFPNTNFITLGLEQNQSEREKP